MTDPIFVVRCEEPVRLEDGTRATITVDRSVYPFVLTPDNGFKLWDKAKEFPKIFNSIITESPDKFLDAFFKFDTRSLEASAEALLWVVDDYVGVFSLTNIYHPDDALMHFTFFDKRLRGRANLVREMIKYVFDTYGFNRLSAEIPAYSSTAVLKFVSNEVELNLEGRKKKAIRYKDDLCDLLLYGITQGEVEKWEHQRLRQ